MPGRSLKILSASPLRRLTLGLLGAGLLFVLGSALYLRLVPGGGGAATWGVVLGERLATGGGLAAIGLPIVIWGLLCGGLAWLSASRFSRRIYAALAGLTEAARGLAPAPLPAGEAVGPTTGDELVELRSAFREMATRVQAAYQEVESLNRSLAAKVQQRTEELRQKNLALAFQNEKVIEADRLKSAFFASVSHELRTPLNAILALAEMLRDEIAGPLNPDQRKHLSIIYSSGESLLNLINEVLDLSRIEAGRMEIRREHTTIVDRLLEAVEELRPLAEAKGLALNVEAHGQGQEALVDGEKVRLVFINLLGNAIKFTETGAVTARFQLLEEEGMLSVEVEDTGPGIPAEHQQRIFLEFHQVDMGATSQPKGTGLGLAVSKQMVNLMGGDIWVDSMVDKGSRFAFVIPLGRPAERSDPGGPGPQAATGAVVSEEATAEPRLRVLVIDPDPLGAGVLHRYLRQAGVDVLPAPGYAAALPQLASPKLEAILIRPQAGDDDLLPFLERLTRDSALAALPIIVSASGVLSVATRNQLDALPQLTLLQGDQSVSALVQQALETLAVIPAAPPAEVAGGPHGQATDAA